jgi:ureidoglycolate hydrolase
MMRTSNDYSQFQRFMATILLFSLGLQSCTKNFSRNLQPEEAQEKSLVQKPTKRSAPPEGHQSALAPPAVSTVDLAEAPMENEEATYASHSSWAPPSLRQSTSTGSSAKVKALHADSASRPRQPLHSITRTQQHSTRLSSLQKIPTSRQVCPVLAPVQEAPTQTEAVTQKSSWATIGAETAFTASGGQKINFSRVNGIWQARVTYPELPDTYTQTLPIICQGHADVEKTLAALQIQRDSSTRSRRIHVLKPSQAPYALRQVVYLGEQGLKGGVQYFEVDTTQISGDSETLSMATTHVVLQMMLATNYQSFGDQAHAIFDLLQEEVSTATLRRHLEGILRLIGNQPIVLAAIPTYLTRFENLPNAEKAEVIGMVITRFLLPMGRIQNTRIKLCKESCLALLEAAEQIGVRPPSGGSIGPDEEIACNTLFQDAHADVASGATHSLEDSPTPEEQAYLARAQEAQENARREAQAIQEQEQREAQEMAEKEAHAAEMHAQRSRETAQSSARLPQERPEEEREGQRMVAREADTVAVENITARLGNALMKMKYSHRLRLKDIVTTKNMLWGPYFDHNYPGVGSNTILYQRHWETQLSTTGPFIITGTEIKGFFLEPPGPPTTTPNMNLRIPPGRYLLEKNKGAKFGLRLYNDQVSKARAILIHSGNEPAETKGCLLPGTGRGEPDSGKLDWVTYSSSKLCKAIVAWFESVRPEEASLLIFEP